ncbi:MAG: hypothetical protein CMJ49_00190 [Planctomycetaceae bacterium]|nr:hypothetical protein [Planctomycetaceae bacterium]
MYTLDPSHSYTMPTCGTFRPPKPWQWPTGGMRYGRCPAMSVSFLTERSAVERCLPEPFSVDTEPIVTVYAVACEDVDWLAGHGYNLVGVDVAAVFNGNVDRDVHGGYCVVMWEDMCEPIIGGREHSGVPKIFADINIEKTPDDGWACKVSRFDHTFLELSVTNLQPLDEQACRDAEKARRDAVWMCYKYIPRLENDGADVSYATVYPTSATCASSATADGAVHFRTATPKQAPTQHEVINLLADLPVLEIRAAAWTDWHEVRAIDRQTQRLQ